MSDHPKLTARRIKHALSYLFPVKIHQDTDMHGQTLYIHLVKGRLQLSTDRAVYSFDDKYDNFAAAFKIIDAAYFQEKKILLLGGGLGSVPFLLEKQAKILAQYTIVEVDPKIIHLFNRYTKPRLQSQFHLVCQDAVTFITQYAFTYDMIVIDIFVDDFIPEEIRTEDFLNACTALLASDGLLLFNWMITTGQNESHFDDFFNLVILPLFPQATYNVTKYNRIIISDKKWLKS